MMENFMGSVQNIYSSIQNQRQFPPFDLERLLRTVFAPKPGEKLCILKVQMRRNGNTLTLIENYAPSIYLEKLLQHN